MDISPVINNSFLWRNIFKHLLWNKTFIQMSLPYFLSTL